jgi:hypothetical protein
MKNKIKLDEAYELDNEPVTTLNLRSGSRYGSVPGLDDSELADPDELERQILVQEFEPVLALPVKVRKSRFHHGVDGEGCVDFGAFGTVDFSRTMPEFDRVRYNADKLKERLKDVVIMFSIVKERMPGRTKYLVLKYLKMEIIELEHIADADMFSLARLYLRARHLRNQIADLREVSRLRQEQRLQAFWES